MSDTFVGFLGITMLVVVGLGILYSIYCAISDSKVPFMVKQHIYRIKQLDTGTKRLLFVIGLSISLLPPFFLGAFEDFNSNYYDFGDLIVDFFVYLVCAALIFVVFLIVVRIALWIIDGYKE